MWHYQVIKHKGFITLVEAIEMEEDKEHGIKKGTAYTEAILTADDVKDMMHCLELMQHDIKNYKPITAKKAGLVI